MSSGLGQNDVPVSPSKEAAPKEGSNDEKKDASNGDVMAAIASLRQSMESRLENIKQDFSQQMADNTKKMMENTQVEGGVLTAKVERLEARLQELEEKRDRRDEELTLPPIPLEQRRVVIKHVKEEEGEDEVSLRQSVGEIFEAMDVDVTVVEVKRIKNPSRPNPKPPIQVTVPDKESRDNIMKNKRTLKDVDRFKSVFVEADKPRREREMEANIRRIVKGIPSLSFRRGRVTEAQRADPPQ